MTSNRRRIGRSSGGNRWLRKRLARLPLRRILVVGAGLTVFALAIGLWMRPGSISLEAGHRATVESIALLKADNATAAREKALEGVRGDPNNPISHITLAMTMLALDDGLAAQAEIQRAVDNGYDVGRVAHLRAHAFLLQGEYDKAIEEADRSSQDFRHEGLRIRAKALTAQGKLADAMASLDEARRLMPNDAIIWADIGRFRFVAGDMIGASEASEQAVKLAPGNIAALILRGEIVRSQFGLTASLPWFERALERDPRHHSALIEYAATLGDVGRTVDALAVTRRALAAQPRSPQAYYLQAVIAARAGEYELAQSILSRVTGTTANLPGALLLAGTLDLNSGRYEQAQVKLGELVARQPMNITARKLLAVALLRTDSARNAIDLLRPVVARSDADSYALTLVARGYERIGIRDVAAQYLDRAAHPVVGNPDSFSADEPLPILASTAGQRPGDPATTLPLIRGLLENNNRSGALALAQRTVSRNAGAPAAHLLVGDVLMLMGRHGEAAHAYQQAASLRFDEPTMLRLVEAHERSGRKAEAANALALFLAQNPINIPALRLSAYWQLAAGDYESAIETLETLRARIGDGDAAINAGLAAAYTGVGEYAAAVELGEAAYVLTPANPAVVDAFGWALHKAGDNRSAIDLLRKGVALAPGHAGIRWHLAQIYAAENRGTEAREQAQAALSDPSFADRAAAQALLSTPQ